MKRKYSLLIIAFIILLTAYLIKLNVQNNNNQVIATINSEPITVQEFNLVLNNYRAEVYSYFKDKYNIKYTNKFWETTFNKENPADIIKQKTIDELIRVNILKILAKQNNIIKDISYSNFLQQLKDENLKRQNALEHSEIIYGPTQYSEEYYYYYSLETIEKKLKEALKDDITITNLEIKDYYDENKDTEYTDNKLAQTLPLNNVKEDIEDKIFDNKFNKLIQQTIKNANINLNSKTIQAITIK